MSQNPAEYERVSVAQVIADLGNRIAQVRLSRNINQDDLAAKAGITRRTLSRLETGQGATLDTLVRVLLGLGLESHLEAMLPNPGMQPMQRLVRKGRERKRARASAVESTVPWKWDEDETP